MTPSAFPSSSQTSAFVPYSSQFSRETEWFTALKELLLKKESHPSLEESDYEMLEDALKTTEHVQANGDEILMLVLRCPKALIQSYVNKLEPIEAKDHLNRLMEEAFVIDPTIDTLEFLHKQGGRISQRYLDITEKKFEKICAERGMAKEDFPEINVKEQIRLDEKVVQVLTDSFQAAREELFTNEYRELIKDLPLDFPKEWTPPVITREVIHHLVISRLLFPMDKEE